MLVFGRRSTGDVAIAPSTVAFINITVEALSMFGASGSTFGSGFGGGLTAASVSSMSKISRSDSTGSSQREKRRGFSEAYAAMSVPLPAS